MTRNFATLALITAFFFMPTAFASQVTKVKGQNALLDLQGESAAPGEMFYTLDSEGKKRGIVQITKVRGEKAIAKIVKGKVDTGMTLLARNASDTVAAKSHKKAAKQDEAPSARSYWGGMLGASSDTMSVQVYNASNQPYQRVGLSGVGFSANAFFDYEVFPQIWFRGLAGVEGFNATGSSACGLANSQGCNAQIYYVDADFLARYVFSEGDYRPWLGVGVGLLLPASKDASALSSSSISTTNVLQVAAGLDWFISPTLFIPVSIEYGLLPKSADVSASWFEVRIGLGVPF